MLLLQLFNLQWALHRCRSVDSPDVSHLPAKRAAEVVVPAAAPSPTEISARLGQSHPEPGPQLLLLAFYARRTMPKVGIGAKMLRIGSRKHEVARLAHEFAVCGGHLKQISGNRTERPLTATGPARHVSSFVVSTLDWKAFSRPGPSLACATVKTSGIFEGTLFWKGSRLPLRLNDRSLSSITLGGSAGPVLDLSWTPNK